MMIKNKEKITFFISSLSGGGAERVVCNLANFFHKKGYIVDVITMSNNHDTYRLDSGINRLCLLDEDDRSNRILDAFSRKKKLKQYVLNNQDVKCYIVMLPITIFMLVRLRKFTNSKIIISERNNPASRSLIEKILMKYSSRRCDGLVVQTEEISKWYNNIKKKVIIPNAINDDIVFPDRQRIKIKKKIVAVGRLKKQKNYPMLIEAFGLFSKKYPDYILEIYGNGNQDNKIRKLINYYGLSDKIKLMGYVDNISERIADASCFVMTSNFEGIPNALIEAMCIGIPSIATDCDGGGTRSLIINGKNGVLIKKGAVDELAKKMVELAGDKNLCKELSKNAVETRHILASEKIYTEWLTFIKQVSEVDV